MSDADSPYRRREGPEPENVGALLGNVVGRRGWAARLEGARIHERWAEIAGEDIARHSEPVRLHGGVLLLRADSLTWATQLRYLTADLAARANAILGEGSVTSVKITTGPTTGPPPT